MVPMAEPTDSESREETALYPDGSLKYSGFLLSGEAHGEWRWFRLDGSLMRTGAFERGSQVGTWRTYHRSGRLVKETNYGDGADTARAKAKPASGARDQGGH